MIEIIWRAQGLEETLGEVDEGTTPVRQGDRSSSVLVADLDQTLRNIVQGLVPTHLPPLAGATRTGADHGPLRTFVVLFEGYSSGAFGTKTGSHFGIVGVALDPDRLSVTDMDLDGAAHSTHATHCFNPLFLHYWDFFHLYPSRASISSASSGPELHAG